MLLSFSNVALKFYDYFRLFILNFFIAIVICKKLKRFICVFRDTKCKRGQLHRCLEYRNFFIFCPPEHGNITHIRNIFK